MEKKLVTPKIFLEKLTQRLKDSKIDKTPSRKKYPSDKMEGIFNEEFQLITELYSELLFKSQSFSEKMAFIFTFFLKTKTGACKLEI